MLAPKTLNPANGAAVEQERRAGSQPTIEQQSVRAPALFQNLAPLAKPYSLNENSKPRLAQRGAIAAFSNTCHRWQLAEPLHFKLLGFGDNEFLGEQILYGRLSAPQDARDRAGLVISISVGLGALFNEDPAAERHWLNTPQPKFQNKTPLAFMLEGKMLNLMKVLAEVERVRGF